MKTTTPWRSSIPWAGAVGWILAGCAVGPDYQAPKTQVPQAWEQAAPTTEPAPAPEATLPRPLTDEPAATTAPTTPPAPSLSRWWEAFADERLTWLETQALEHNHDLRIAAARLRQSRASLAGAKAELWPTIDAGGSAQHQRSSDHLLRPGTPGSSSGEGGFYQAGFDAAWEIDVFGGLRRGVEAAQADEAAALAQQQQVMLSFTAEVARQYVLLRSLRERLAIAQDNLRLQQDSLDLVHAKRDAGLATELEETQAQSLVSTTRAQVPALESLVTQTTYSLGVLVAMTPGQITQWWDTQPPAVESAATPATSSISTPQAEGTTTAPAANAPAPAPAPVWTQEALARVWAIPLGVPADLLRRRPDVAGAERQLAAATARVGVATAQLYPQFSLLGTLGLQSVEAADFFDAGSRYYTLGPSVHWRFLEFGRIQAQIAGQNAQVDAALATYEKAVLTAVSEVETAMSSLRREDQRRQALAAAEASDRRAVTLAHDLYQQGLATYLSVLDTQRQALQTQDQLAQSRAQVLQQRIALYKAVGGGWE